MILGFNIAIGDALWLRPKETFFVESQYPKMKRCTILSCDMHQEISFEMIADALPLWEGWIDRKFLSHAQWQFQYTYNALQCILLDYACAQLGIKTLRVSTDVGDAINSKSEIFEAFQSMYLYMLEKISRLRLTNSLSVLSRLILKN